MNSEVYYSVARVLQDCIGLHETIG